MKKIVIKLKWNWSCDELNFSFPLLSPLHLRNVWSSWYGFFLGISIIHRTSMLGYIEICKYSWLKAELGLSVTFIFHKKADKHENLVNKEVIYTYSFVSTSFLDTINTIYKKGCVGTRLNCHESGITSQDFQRLGLLGFTCDVGMSQHLFAQRKCQTFISQWSHMANETGRFNVTLQRTALWSSANLMFFIELKISRSLLDILGIDVLGIF